MPTYNLITSQSDRSNFEDMIRRDAAGMLQTLPFNEGQEDDAWLQDGQQYAKVAFDNFRIIAVGQKNIDEGIDGKEYSIVIDDFPEAEASYLTIFPQAVRDWQKEMMVDYLTEEMTDDDGHGYTGYIVVTPGGHLNGLAFNPVVIDIVGLEQDGNQVAYRCSDDGHDDDWQIGFIENSVEEALSQREQIKELDKELKEIRRIDHIRVALTFV